MARTHRQELADKHERNTKMVQEYLRLVKPGNKSDEGPVEIYTRHCVSRQRFYQILEAYGVKATYLQHIMRTRR